MNLVGLFVAADHPGLPRALERVLSVLVADTPISILSWPALEARLLAGDVPARSGLVTYLTFPSAVETVARLCWARCDESLPTLSRRLSYVVLSNVNEARTKRLVPMFEAVGNRVVPPPYRLADLMRCLTKVEAVDEQSLEDNCRRSRPEVIREILRHDIRNGIAAADWSLVEELTHFLAGVDEPDTIRRLEAFLGIVSVPGREAAEATAGLPGWCLDSRTANARNYPGSFVRLGRAR